jgi:hypothetical protein
MRMVALCRAIIFAAALGCIAQATRAQTAPPGAAGAPPGPPAKLLQEDRARTGDAAAPVAVPSFSLHRVDGGYLRLNGENGTVAFCTPRNPSWNCQSVTGARTAAEKEVVCTPRGDPEWSCQDLSVDRAALDKEIERLQQEVTSLKQASDRRQEETTSLKQGMDRWRGEIASLKQEFDRRQAEVVTLRQQVEHRLEQVSSLKQEVARRQDEIISLKQAAERGRDEIMTLKQEAERQQDEVTSLKQEITALRTPPPPVERKNDDLTITLPDRDDIARAGAYLQDTARDAWHRLVDMIAQFQRDMLRKS